MNTLITAWAAAATSMCGILRIGELLAGTAFGWRKAGRSHPTILPSRSYSAQVHLGEQARAVSESAAEELTQ